MNFGLYEYPPKLVNQKYISVFPEIRPKHPSIWNDEFDEDSLNQKWIRLFQTQAAASSSIDGITDQGINRCAASSFINTSPVATNSWAQLFAQSFCLGGSFFIHAQGSVANFSSTSFAGFGIMLIDSTTGKTLELVWQKSTTDTLGLYAQTRSHYSSTTTTAISSDVNYGTAGNANYFSNKTFQIGIGVDSTGTKFYYGAPNRFGKMYFLSGTPRTINTDFARMPDMIGFGLNARSSIDFFRVYVGISDPFGNNLNYE